MKNILIIDPADFLGGAELFTIDILLELAQKKDIVFTLITSGKSTEYLEKIPKEIKVEMMSIPRLRPFRPLALIKIVWKIKREIKKNQIDIVHSNSVRAGIICRFLNVPWTHFAHDFTTPKRLSFLFQKAEKIFSCSQVVKEDLMKKGISGKKIRVIPNGIKSSLRLNRNQHGDIKNPVISLVGRIDTWKGQDIFVQAAELLQKDLPKADFRIYGKASQHDKKTITFEKQLKNLVEEKNLTNVQFMGYKEKEEVFSETDILIHASTKPEPFGRTVLEALAYGVPVLASDDGGIREILSGRDFFPFRIPANNPKKLAKGILTLVRDKKLQEKYQQLAKQRVQAFSLRQITKQIKKEWEDV